MFCVFALGPGVYNRGSYFNVILVWREMYSMTCSLQPQWKIVFIRCICSKFYFIPFRLPVQLGVWIISLAQHGLSNCNNKVMLVMGQRGSSCPHGSMKNRFHSTYMSTMIISQTLTLELNALKLDQH